MRTSHLISLVILPLWMLGCLNCSRQRQTIPPAISVETSTPRNQPTLQIDCNSYIPDQFGKPLTETEREISYTHAELNYLGYQIRQVTRKVDMNADVRGGPKLYEDLQYVIIKRHGKIVARFLGQPEHLVEAQFGLFSFFGGTEKQLVIEQTANKYWRYWIVNLRPRLEILYDSGKYDLVYWLRTIDFDHDGRFELVQNLGTFWYVLGSNVDSPRPEIILKYDPKIHKYLPANPRFQSESLRDISQRITKGEEIKQNTGYSCPSLVYDVTLRYLYAGRRQDAWRFFAREYDEKNKNEQKESIKKTLRKDAVYNAIYRTRRAS